MTVLYRVLQSTPVDEKGFSLIEVLVSLLILAVALSGLIGMQVTALRLNNANLELDMAREVLLRVIDEVKTLSNPELRVANKSNLLSGGGDDLTDLATDYQLTGIGTSTPSGYDFTRWIGVSETTMSGGVRDFTVKLDVDEQYLLQDVLARAQVSAYWRPQGESMSARTVDSMQLVFFIQRK